MSKKLKIWIALLTVYIFWGGTYLFIHFAVETIPPPPEGMVGSAV